MKKIKNTKKSQQLKNAKVILIPEDTYIEFKIDHEKKTVRIPLAMIEKFENNIHFLMMMARHTVETLGAGYSLYAELDGDEVKLA